TAGPISQDQLRLALDPPGFYPAHASILHINTPVRNRSARLASTVLSPPGRHPHDVEQVCKIGRRQSDPAFDVIAFVKGRLPTVHRLRTAWCGREDSNLKPNDYQPPALSIEHSGAVS